MKFSKKILITVILILLICQNLLNAITGDRIRELNYMSKEELLSEINKLTNKVDLNKEDNELIGELGICYQILASKYNENVKGKNEEYLEKSLKIKRVPVFLAYYGMTQMIKAKKAFNPLDKMEYSKTGIKYIDSAIESDKDNFQIRLLRIRNSIKNKMLKRENIAKIDIAYCEELYKNKKIGNEDYAELILFKAMLFENNNEKEKALELYRLLEEKYSSTKIWQLYKNGKINLKG